MFGVLTLLLLSKFFICLRGNNHQQIKAKFTLENKGKQLIKACFDPNIDQINY